jgi:transposase-like protein
VKEKKVQNKYEQEFERQAVEMVIHSGKTQAQIARELGVSGYSLNLWKTAYLKRMEPAQLGSRQMSPEQMVAEVKSQQKEIEYLKRQREILKKAMRSENWDCGSFGSNRVASSYARSAGSTRQ